MSDHNSVLKGMKSAKAAVVQMAKAGLPQGLRSKGDELIKKIDGILKGMDQALKLRDTWRQTQNGMPALEKEIDTLTKAVTTAETSNKALGAGRLTKAREVIKWAGAVERWSDVMNQNKMIAYTVNRLQVTGLAFLAPEIGYWDAEAFRAKSDGLTVFRKNLPNVDSKNKLPQDLAVLETKIDELLALYNKGESAAKPANQSRLSIVNKQTNLEAQKKRLTPIETQLQKLLDQVFDDVDDAQTLGQQIRTGTPKEMGKMIALVIGNLFDARVDYSDQKASEWAARN